MKMNRRDTIKLLATSGALLSLPTWANGWRRESIDTFVSSFAQEQQTMLASVADTIIPQGDGIGALSVRVDKFLEKLFDRCYEKEVGDNIKKQLEALDAAALKEHGKGFRACDQQQRELLLGRFATSEVKQEKDFFNLVKSETIRGFNTSKEVMTKYFNYKIAPGHYYGCVDVKA